MTHNVYLLDRDRENRYGRPYTDIPKSAPTGPRAERDSDRDRERSRLASPYNSSSAYKSGKDIRRPGSTSGYSDRLPSTSGGGTNYG